MEVITLLGNTIVTIGLAVITAGIVIRAGSNWQILWFPIGKPFMMKRES